MINKTQLIIILIAVTIICSYGFYLSENDFFKWLNVVAGVVMSAKALLLYTLEE